jgi:hypothetical protein
MAELVPEDEGELVLALHLLHEAAGDEDETAWKGERIRLLVPSIGNQPQNVPLRLIP